MTRSYSVHEINELRRVVENKYLYGTYGLKLGCGMSRTYKEDEKTACVEEMVRTHMLAGHTAEDLIASEEVQEVAIDGDVG